MLLNRTSAKIVGLLLSIALLVISILASILFGYTETNWHMLVEAYTAFDGSNEHLIIQNARVPRAFIAASVGASLGIAGAIMQALTRNPLASPGIFGVNGGAGFFIVTAVSFYSVSSLHAFTWIAFAGAALAAITVYFVGSVGRGGLTPVKLTLAGAAMAALFSSLTQGLLVLNETALEEVLFWLAGSVQGRKLEILGSVFPYLVGGWVLALAISKQINVLLMGEDVARGLGQNTGLVKLGGALVIVLLAGGSVAVAGPIAFVGIVVPHLAKALVGTDHRWVIPYSGLIGGVLLLLADVGARYVIMPQEVPVGVMTAVIGTPFFVYIARKGLTVR